MIGKRLQNRDDYRLRIGDHRVIFGIDQSGTPIVAKIHVDFRFIGLEHELLSLAKYREVFEEQLTFLKDQERVRLRARLTSAESEMDDAERQFASEQVDLLVEEILPRFFRGPYLIALWALFESAIIELADYLAKKKQLLLKLRDVRGRDPMDKWNKYYSHVAGYRFVTLCGFCQNDTLQCLRKIGPVPYVVVFDKETVLKNRVILREVSHQLQRSGSAAARARSARDVGWNPLVGHNSPRANFGQYPG